MGEASVYDVREETVVRARRRQADKTLPQAFTGLISQADMLLTNGHDPYRGEATSWVNTRRRQGGHHKSFFTENLIYALTSPHR